MAGGSPPLSVTVTTTSRSADRSRAPLPRAGAAGRADHHHVPVVAGRTGRRRAQGVGGGLEVRVLVEAENHAAKQPKRRRIRAPDDGVAGDAVGGVRVAGLYQAHVSAVLPHFEGRRGGREHRQGVGVGPGGGRRRPVPGAFVVDLPYLHVVGGVPGKPRDRHPPEPGRVALLRPVPLRRTGPVPDLVAREPRTGVRRLHPGHAQARLRDRRHRRRGRGGRWLPHIRHRHQHRLVRSLLARAGPARGPHHEHVLVIAGQAQRIGAVLVPRILEVGRSREAQRPGLGHDRELCPIRALDDRVAGDAVAPVVVGRRHLAHLRRVLFDLERRRAGVEHGRRVDRHRRRGALRRRTRSVRVDRPHLEGVLRAVVQPADRVAGRDGGVAAVAGGRHGGPVGRPAHAAVAADPVFVADDRRTAGVGGRGPTQHGLLETGLRGQGTRRARQLVVVADGKGVTCPARYHDDGFVALQAAVIRDSEHERCADLVGGAGGVRRELRGRPLEAERSIGVIALRPGSRSRPVGDDHDVVTAVRRMVVHRRGRNRQRQLSRVLVHLFRPGDRDAEPWGASSCTWTDAEAASATP